MSDDRRKQIRAAVQAVFLPAPQPAKPRRAIDPALYEPRVQAAIRRYAIERTESPTAKPVVDEHGNRWASATIAAGAMGGSIAGLTAAIRKAKPFFGVRYWFVKDAPAHVLRRKVLARRAEAA